MSFAHPRLERSDYLALGRPASLWFRFERCEVYLRQGRRLLDGQSIFAVEIANISSPVQQRGQFYRLIGLIAKKSPLDWIIVENVLNEHLVASLRRRGWQERPGGFDQPCFYKRISDLRTE
jgi:hypothetical protein